MGCDALAMKGDFVLSAHEKDDALTLDIATPDEMSWVSELPSIEK